MHYQFKCIISENLKIGRNFKIQPGQFPHFITNTVWGLDEMYDSPRACLEVKWKVKVAESCLTLWDPHGLYSSWNSPSQNNGVGSHSLLQGIFPMEGSKPGLLHCRQILYQLSHQGSSRILEWVAYPFSNSYSWPRNQTRVSFIAGGFFTSWATREGPKELYLNFEKRSLWYVFTCPFWV